MTGEQEVQVQKLLDALDKISNDYAEKAESYMEVVRIACRMAEKLGDEDTDVLALKALLTFQLAESMDRTHKWREFR